MIYVILVIMLILFVFGFDISFFIGDIGFTTSHSGLLTKEQLILKTLEDMGIDEELDDGEGKK